MKRINCKILFMIFMCFACAAFGQTAIENLPSNQPLTREIKGGKTHNYKINLKAGEFLRVLVEQRGADVVIRLFAPDGKLLAERDRPNGTNGEESLSAEAVAAGEYRLEIAALEAGAAAGKYTVRSESPRFVTAADKRRIAAETAFQEAMKLRETKAEESWRKALAKYEEALSAWQSLTDYYAEALTLSTMGFTESELGDSEQTRKRFVLALQKAEAIKSESLVGDIRIGLQTLAGSYAEAGLKLFEEGTLKSRQAAADKFKAASELYREAKDRTSEANVQLFLGTIADDFGDKTTALGYYEKALMIFRLVDDKRGEATTLSNIGKVYSDLGNTQQALKLFNESLPLRRAIGDKSGEAATLSNIGSVYSVLGEILQALKFFNETLLLDREVGDKRGEAGTLKSIGEIYLDLGDNQQALKFFNEALSLSRAIGDKRGEGGALVGIGGVHSALGEKQQALKFFNEALLISRVFGNKDGEAAMFNNIGLVYRDLGDSQQALKFLKDSLSLLRAIGDKRGEATTLYNIGLVYDDLGEEQQALRFYNDSLLLRRQVGDKNGEADTLNGIGGVYDDLGEEQQALKCFNEALPIHRAVGDKNGEATTLNNIGSVYNDLGDNNKALKFYNESLLLHRVIGDKLGEAITLNNIGSAYLKTENKQQALNFFNESLLLRRVVGDKRGEAKTLNNLMIFWESQQNQRLAILYGKQSVNVLQQLRANIQTLDKELKSSFLKSVESTYRNLSDVLIAEGRILEAEQVLNLLKTEEFGAVLRRTGNNENLLPYSAAEESSLKIIDGLATLGGQRAELLALKARGAFPADGDARLTEIDAQIAKANAEFRRSLDALARAAPVEFDLKQAQTLQSDLRELGAGTVALYTLVVCGDDSPLETVSMQKTDAKQCEKVRTGWIILVTPDFRKAYPIDVRELNETVAALRQALSSDKYDSAPVAKKLYDKLFRQTSDKQKTTLEADLDEYFAKTKATQKTLMWSLDGVLRYIPTAVLHDGNSYLIEKYRSFVFTTASLTRLKDKNKPDWTIFGLGVSEARDGFNALPGVKRELLAIVRDGQLKNTGAIMPGVIRLDKDFTRKAFLEGLREGYPVVHLASHFSYKNKQEDSFLLLGDSHLTLGEMRDFAPIFENVDLLALSACNTATSDADNGKEVEGLGFVAQSLGAKSVIASLWEVADTGTDELMIRFYKLRSENPQMQKGEAFRQAQISMLGAKTDANKSGGSRSDVFKLDGSEVKLPLFVKDEKKPFAHPHYWAPFVLIGNWR